MDDKLNNGSIIKLSPNAQRLFLVFSLTHDRATMKRWDGNPKEMYAEVLPIATPMGQKVMEWVLEHERGKDTAPWTRTELTPHLKKWRFNKLDKAIVVGNVDELRNHLIDTGAITGPDEYARMGVYANV